MLNSERWEKAQVYEKEYWKGIADKIALDASSQLTWYDWKARQFEKKLANVNPDPIIKDGRILEIGCGPIGIVRYMSWGTRFAVDPLNDYYKENRELVALRNTEVTYITGKGEQLPFPDNHFSVVIIDNMLDHVSDPGAVLNEIFRVLSPSGYLYVELNVHTYWGYLLHSLLAKLNIDKGHPHSYTPDKIRRFLNLYKYDVKWDLVDSYLEAKKNDIESSSVKSKIKGYTGLSEFIYSAVCVKAV